MRQLSGTTLSAIINHKHESPEVTRQRSTGGQSRQHIHFWCFAVCARNIVMQSHKSMMVAEPG